MKTFEYKLGIRDRKFITKARRKFPLTVIPLPPSRNPDITNDFAHKITKLRLALVVSFLWGTKIVDDAAESALIDH